MSIEINLAPFPTKQGLIIALEIARYELSSDQINRITDFINILDNSYNEHKIIITGILYNDLMECIAIFKKSKSIHWIRDDFVKEVLHFSRLRV